VLVALSPQPHVLRLLSNAIVRKSELSACSQVTGVRLPVCGQFLSALSNGSFFLFFYWFFLFFF
jgi:hypothetical protein